MRLLGYTISTRQDCFISGVCSGVHVLGLEVSLALELCKKVFQNRGELAQTRWGDTARVTLRWCPPSRRCGGRGAISMRAVSLAE